MFFAFRFNFNMSQDPDSMLNPKQVSDFHADAWFGRSRRPKSASRRSRARGPRAVATARARAAAESKLREFFSRNFCMVAIVRFMNRAKFRSTPVLHRKPQSKIRPGSAGKNSPVRIFSTISAHPVRVFIIKCPTCDVLIYRYNTKF